MKAMRKIRGAGYQMISIVEHTAHVKRERRATCALEAFPRFQFCRLPNGYSGIHMPPSAKPRVEIEYCTQCRWLLRAAWMAQELLVTFEQDIGGVTLVPGTGGTFEIRIDGARIVSFR